MDGTRQMHFGQENGPFSGRLVVFETPPAKYASQRFSTSCAAQPIGLPLIQKSTGPFVDHSLRLLSAMIGKINIGS